MKNKITKHNERDNGSMAWVISITFVSWLLTNAPLIYLVITYSKENRLSDILSFWKFAPNQFLFNFLFLPFAIFFTLLSVKTLTLKIKPLLNIDYSYFIKTFFYDNWAAVSMVAVILAAIITLVVYYNSGFSIDKLKPEYTNRAIKIIQSHIVADKAVIVPEDTTVQDLDALTDNEYIFAVSNRKFQMNLKLVNEALQGLSVLQIFITIFFVAIIVICTFLVCHLIQHPNSIPIKDIKYLINMITAVAICYSFFPICYNLYKKTIYDITQMETTMSQDVLALVAIMLLILFIRLIYPENRNSMQSIMINSLPAFFVVSGFGVLNLKFGDIISRIIGVQSSIGTQIIIVLIIIIVGFSSALVFGANDK